MFSKKSKEKRELDAVEMRAKIKGSIRDMEAFVAKSEEKKADLLAKARRAKANNDNATFKLACFGLASTLSLKNRVEKMIQTIEIVMTLTDVAEMSRGFMSGMERTCRDLADSTKGLKFDKLSKSFDGAMGNVSDMFGGLDKMMSDMALGFESMDMELDPELSMQISDMIEKEEIASVDNLDQEIEEKLKKLKTTKA